MDNQKDQSGTTPDPTNASRNANANSSASRKPAATPSASESTPNPTAQSPATTPNAQSQTTANAGTDRKGEGQQTNAPEGTVLDTALNSGKKWIEDSGVLNSVNQLPQSLKDLGNRAADRISGLSTTQKVVGGAILAAGLGWLATRKGKSSSSDSSSYNYGRQRDAGSYGRKSYGYQAPDANTSSQPAAGATGRSDSGSVYANGGSRFGSDAGKTTTSSHFDSGRATEGFGASAATDHGAQSSSSRTANSDFGSSSNE